MSPEKLAYMANQIGRAFAYQQHDTAVASVAEHLVKFWDPRMRREIVAAARGEAVRLDPVVAEAVRRLG